jgi:multiple sugar transport system ATP-binding protein
MKRGHLQQVDSPQALYDHPANLFVAGFIGSPAMNMVEATLRTAGEDLVAGFGSSELVLDPAFVREKPELKGYEGRRVVLGIRPESIEHERFAGTDPNGRRLEATADLRESLGSEALVHFHIDAPPVLTEDTVDLVRDREETEDVDGVIDERTATFVAKVDPRADIRIGAPVPLVVDTSRLHAFDPQTGRAIG